MLDSERLCWFFLTIPFAGFLLAEAVTNAFYNRYVIALLPGVAVGFACVVSRYLIKPASVVLLLVIATLMVGRQMATARRPESIEPSSANTQAPTREALAAEEKIVADGRKTIITHFLLLDAMRYYSKRPDLYAMFGPDSDPLFCKYFAGSCWNLDIAKTHAGEMAAIYPSNKLLSEMSDAGFQATVRMTEPPVVYFSPR
jgi:hypothetical protein